MLLTTCVGWLDWKSVTVFTFHMASEKTTKELSNHKSPHPTSPTPSDDSWRFVAGVFRVFVDTPDFEAPFDV